MTKAQLKALMERFVDRQDNYQRDEWYCTERDIAEYVLKQFAEELKINLFDGV